jgi:MFS family permease
MFACICEFSAQTMPNYSLERPLSRKETGKDGFRGMDGMTIERQIGFDAGETGAASPKKTLAAACGIHAVHDGYTDALYMLLPVWRDEFGLSYAAVGVLRALYSAVMAGLQVPAASLGSRFSPVLLLAAGTALAGLGYMLAGASTGLALLAVSLMLGGIGSSIQHPIGADLVASAYPNNLRPALGTYNFAGDIGKMAFPAGVSLLLTFASWRETAFVIGAVGIASAAALVLLLPFAQAGRAHPKASAKPEASASPPLSAAKGFRTLLSIGMADSATRMSFMTFLPFVLATKSASPAITGLALSLTFAGGAFGKLAVGFIGGRLGVARTIIVTKALTAALILAVFLLPLTAALAVLPLLGTMLNGSSSVVYGSVPDFCTAEARARAFGVFYTATIGSGALAPILAGSVTDFIGLAAMTVCIACTAVLTLTLALFLPRPADEVEVEAR